MERATMGNLSRRKGATAERDVIHLLQPIVDRAYDEMRRTGYGVGTTPQLQRNTLQSDRGGVDIAGLPWAAIEVKHHAALALPEWWTQTVEQALQLQAIPILIYRRTGGPWHVRIQIIIPIGDSAEYCCPGDISFAAFGDWFMRRCQFAAHQEWRRSRMN